VPKTRLFTCLGSALVLGGDLLQMGQELLVV